MTQLKSVKQLAGAVAILLLAIASDAFAQTTSPKTAPNALDGVYLMPGVEFSVAVDDRGNWPQLLQLPNGEILATFYNHPSHGFGCGDIEAWASEDGGRSWRFRSKVSDHSEQPEHCRMNHAFGRTAKGELIVLVSGWSKGRRPPALPIQVCKSSDDGRTWKRHLLPIDQYPYGRMVLSPDGQLTAAIYEMDHREERGLCHLYVSRDDGQTWTRMQSLGKEERANETALLHCRDGKWLAAARSGKDGSLYLYASTDEGRTWSAGRKAPLPGHPGDLLQLADGGILLLAGQRGASKSGIVGCVSPDCGETWSPFSTFIAVPWMSDHGYPSSVQRPDGTIVTAYYWGGRAEEGKYGGLTNLPHSRGLPWHPRYHMGVMRWRPEQLASPPAPSPQR